LKWPDGSDNADHPMMNLARAREIIAAFPAGDSIKAAQDAARWLASIGDAAVLKLAPRYALINMIDAPIKPHGEVLLEQYLELKPQSKFQEIQLWNAATAFWKTLGDAYGVCIAQADSDKAAAAAFRKTLPVLVARAMRTQMLQIKWILLRYGYVGDTYWSAVASLYQLAQAGGYLDEVVDIYGGAHGSGTVRREFMRVLMLGVSSTGALSPVKQNIAERAIAHFSNAFVSDTQAAEGLNFVFDLNGGVSPSRTLGNLPGGARLLYFGAGGALDGAQYIIDSINNTGTPGADINLGPNENIDQMADTLLHLAFNWEKELPARDSERRRVTATLQVTHGFDGIMSQGFGRGVSETWIVENASAEGYGTIVPDRRSEWLQVGVLIGIRSEGGDAPWGAGVVRRVETDTRGQRHAGIQVISRAVNAGTMCALQASGGRAASHYVILLDPEPSQSGYMQAVMRPGIFSLNEVLEATRTEDGKTFFLSPSGRIESSPDFEHVRFKAAG
jgi:hypothetical protein